jgi:AraC-like DNA-binding protein
MRDEPTFPLLLAQAITVEAFSPPIFACFCSADLNMALKRLAQYKPIVGPLRLDIGQNDQQTVLAFSGLPENGPAPRSLIAFELAFWVQVARLATREQIVPQAVHVTMSLPEMETYEAFFGIQITQDRFNGLTFSAEDAQKPFLTANESMWSIFEPELRKRMKDLDQEAGFRDRVRACLIEILASGQYSMADVASRLAVSTRTLQRRLREENTSFQKELDGLREELAHHYLSRSDYSSGQIAFLLGYQDPNSFFRAFRTWTGQTPELARTDFRSARI